MIRCSLGTAKVLGLKSVKADALPTTAYLMIGDRCKFNCAFCAQARDSGARADMLSRVSWPDFEGEKVLKGLATPGAQENLERICFQVVQDHAALDETKSWVKEVQAHSQAPICVSAGPKNLAEIEELITMGVDKVSIALDAATPEVFAKMKDGVWQVRYELLLAAAERFPGHMATHLIVGLGESEEEMIRRIQELCALGITVALFAFTPVKGTRLEDQKPPLLVHYRKIQAAQYLIQHGAPVHFVFREGKLVSYGIAKTELQTAFESGAAFCTSGCSGCNRPYYNETPGQTLYNYPRPLTEEEVQAAWELLAAELEFEK